MQDKVGHLITATEAGRVAGVDARTVARWAREDHVPGLGVEIAGRLFIRHPILMDLLEGHARDASALATRTTTD